jgi:hypothetical protein
MGRKLDFFTWRDGITTWRNKSKANRKKSQIELYREMVLFYGARKDLPSLYTTSAEAEWIKNGSPYYKVWPEMADALSNISIEIDAKRLVLPFNTYSIRLPKTECFRETPTSPAVCSMLVHKEDYLLDLAKEFGMKALSAFLQTEAAPKDDRDYSLMIHYQFDTEKDCDWMGWYFRMGIKEGELLSEQFDVFWDESAQYLIGYNPSKEFTERLLKLAISVAFFGVHNHEVIAPDIPNRYIERYHRATAKRDTVEAKKLLDRAKKMGHFGWKIGSEISLPQPIVRHINDRGSTGQGNELTFGHLRSGHMRLQQVGKRDDPSYELIFIAPTVVRPDLPIRSTRGFRIEDKLLRK